MTAFPALPELDDLFKPNLLEPVAAPIAIRPPRKIREVATDSIINAQRAITPPAVAEQRTTKRMSVSELNNTDMGNLMERYQATKYDDRGPVTRFLDLLDMPRNLIAGTLFPTLRRRKEAEGDVGTGGFGNVRFSDILDEMGVAPGIIRGVVGFIGDVAMDPLTYIGAPGWGMRLVGTGGKVVEGTAAGRRALEAGFAAAARGAPVADEAVAKVIRAAGYGEEALAAKRGTQNAKALTAEIRNRVLGKSSAGKFGTAMQWIGGEVGTEGSILADAFHSEIKSDMSEAAREFFGKHGLASAPGIGIGVGPVAAKSAIAHIPFTSYGLYVPALTGRALEAGKTATIASAGFKDATGVLGQQGNDLGSLASKVAAKRDTIRKLMEESDALSAVDVSKSATPLTDASTIENRRSAIKDQIAAIRDEISSHYDEAKGIVYGPNGSIGLSPGSDGNRLDSVADVMWQRGQLSRIEADAAEVLNKNRDTLETVNEYRRIMGAAKLNEKVDARIAEMGLDESGVLMPGPGDQVQWTSQGVGQFKDPRTIESLHTGPDGKAYAKLVPESWNPNPESMVPVNELKHWGEAPQAPEPIDEIRQALRSEEIQKLAASGQLKKAQQELLLMPDDKAAALEALADSIHNEFSIKMAQAQAVHGTLAEAANRTSNRQLADVAADLIGLGPSTGGYSAFTPIRQVTRHLFGDDHTVTQYALRKFDAMDEWARKMFGQTKGEAGRVRRQVELSRDSAGVAARHAKMNGLIEDLKTALRESSIPEEHWQEASDLLTAEAVSQRMKAGDNWSVHGSPVTEMLERAKNGPLAGAMPRIQAIASKNLDILDSMALHELDARVLDAHVPDYLPGRATMEGADILKNARDNAGVAEGAVPGPFGNEAFQKPKSMTRAVWTDANGVVHDMYRLEHDYYSGFLGASNNLSDVGVQRLQAAKQQNLGFADYNAEFWNKRDWKPGEIEQAAKGLSQLEQNVFRSKVYNELPDTYKIGQASFKQADPFLLNQEFPNRLGFMVPGKDIPRGMFETSFAELMAARSEAHERAMIAANAKMILDQHAAAVTNAAKGLAVSAINSDANSAVIRMSNGATATIEKSPHGDFIYRIGGQKYRRLRGVGEVGDALNDLGAGIYDRKALNAILPESVAEAYERLAQVPGKKHEYLQMYDKFLNVWKMTTLAHWSWIIGDVAGGLIQALAAGVKPVEFIKSLKDAIRLAFASDKPELLKTMTVTIGGKAMSGTEAIELLTRHTLPVGHVHGEPVAQLVRDGHVVPGYQSRILSSTTIKDPVGAVTQRLRDMRTRAAIKTKVGFDATAWSKIPHGKKLRNAKQLLWDEGFIRNMISPFNALNGRANDSLRFATFMAFMNDGHDAAGAAAKTLESMFDVGDLTKFETETMKRLIPFYSWMKHSGVYWTKKLMQNPSLANMAPRVKRAIEEGLYGDDAVPDHLRPNWMRDQLALQIGSDPTKRYALTLGTAIPQETALAVGAAATSPITGVMGLKQLLEQVGFGLALPIKAATELAAGRESFSGRTIGFSPNEGDLTVGEYLAGQVRPLREFGVGNIREGPIQKALGSGVVPGASRLLLGGRSQPFDDERIKQNLVKQFKDSEQNIRKRITIAEREKNAAASTEARATLMRLYDTMVKRGLDDHVPAWARMQLEELHAGGG